MLYVEILYVRNATWAIEEGGITFTPSWEMQGGAAVFSSSASMRRGINFSTADIDAGLPPGADADGVAIAFLVSAYPSPERARADSIGRQLHELLPQANLIRIFCPGVAALPESGNSGDHSESTVNSLGEAIEICTSWREVCSKRDVSSEPQRVDAVRTAIPPFSNTALHRFFKLAKKNVSSALEK